MVTLVTAPQERCWGVAYRVAGDQVQDTLETLDRRESAGYERISVSLEVPSHPQPLEALTYAAGPDNLQYLGPSSLVEMAAQIRRCSGPSGRNRDYLTDLADALRRLNIQDPHVESLERELLRGVLPD
ncbi:MAG: gamma-glutamylcyclotransferase [Myxococcota bacterium]|nr:gamma-glutamylcyclotransferase [Myxococcota bacterium]